MSTTEVGSAQEYSALHALIERLYAAAALQDKTVRTASTNDGTFVSPVTARQLSALCASRDQQRGLASYLAETRMAFVSPRYAGRGCWEVHLDGVDVVLKFVMSTGEVRLTIK